MKLYDFDSGNKVYVPTRVVESFDGRMHHMTTHGIIKSFNKAKKEALKHLYIANNQLDELIAETESLEESDVYDRESF